MVDTVVHTNPTIYLQSAQNPKNIPGRRGHGYMGSIGLTVKSRMFQPFSLMLVGCSRRCPASTTWLITHTNPSIHLHTEKYPGIIPGSGGQGIIEARVSSQADSNHFRQHWLGCHVTMDQLSQKWLGQRDEACMSSRSKTSQAIF